LSEIIEAVNKLFEALDKFQLQGRLDLEIVNLGEDVYAEFIRISVESKLSLVEHLEFFKL
jgi:hypothetical protein